MSLSKGIYTYTYLPHPGIFILTIGFFTYPYATCHDAEGSHAIKERMIEAEHNGNGESTDRFVARAQEEVKREERRGRGLL